LLSGEPGSVQDTHTHDDDQNGKAKEKRRKKEREKKNIYILWYMRVYRSICLSSRHQLVDFYRLYTKINKQSIDSTTTKLRGKKGVLHLTNYWYFFIFIGIKRRDLFLKFRHKSCPVLSIRKVVLKKVIKDG
jgi:hypothetical protein